MLWSVRLDACYLQKHIRYMQTFQQESENGRAHLVALLSVWPSTAQSLLVLLGQVSDSPHFPHALKRAYLLYQAGCDLRAPNLSFKAP